MNNKGTSRGQKILEGQNEHFDYNRGTNLGIIKKKSNKRLGIPRIHNAPSTTSSSWHLNLQGSSRVTKREAYLFKYSQNQELPTFEASSSSQICREREISVFH